MNLEFSPNGNFCAIFRKRLNNLQIYQVDKNNIEGLLDKILEDDIYKEFDEVPALKDTHVLQFDVNSRYLACYGTKTINIIGLGEDTDYNIITKQIDMK